MCLQDVGSLALLIRPNGYGFHITVNFIYTSNFHNKKTRWLSILFSKKMFDFLNNNIMLF